MVAVAPITGNAPDLYPQNSTSNKMIPCKEAESNDRLSIPIECESAAPVSATDNADPQTVTANGNGSRQHAENDIHVEVPRFSDSTVDSNERKMAVDILKIIESYGVDYEKTGGSWKGLESFVQTVMEQVNRHEPIRMILPAFPFKSPNSRDKVLGTMPDFGEELALFHLNGLCDNIGKVYEPGADVYISSDGLVYNGKPSK